jgi:hypothetical protein
MRFRIMGVAMLLTCGWSVAAPGTGPSWERKTVLLTQAGVKLQVAEGEKSRPRPPVPETYRERPTIAADCRSAG